MNEYLKRQREIIDYRPESFSPHIMRFVQKISSEKGIEDKGAIGIEDVIRHNHLSVLDRLIDLELLTYKAKEIINESNMFSKDILKILNDVFDNDALQVKQIQEIFKLKNFGGVDVDYYKIKNNIESMLENLLIEHQKPVNKIDYDVINKDTKINYLINSFATKKVTHYRKIYDILESNSQKDKVYKYSEDDIKVLEDYNKFKEKELNLSQKKYMSLAFDQSFFESLSIMYEKRKETAFYSVRQKDSDSIIGAQSSELLSYSNAQFELTVIDFYKHIELETQHFESFMTIFESYVDNNNMLDYLKN